MADETPTKLENECECSTSNCSHEECSSEELEEISDDEVETIITSVTLIDKNSNLHFTAAHGLNELIQRDLDDPDQKIDAENFMGWTPLMMAVRNGKMEAAKLLLERGADITKKNKFGVNIFTMSIASGKVELMEMILQHMLQGGISRNRIQENLSPIALTILYKRDHLLEWLVNQGFSINAITPKTGLTPLMFAAALPSEKVMQMLIAKGAKKNIRNCMGFKYKDITLWRSRGLEYLMQKHCANEHAPEVNVENDIKTQTNHYLLTTDIKKNEIELKRNPQTFCSPEIDYKVPNNTPSSAMNNKAPVSPDKKTNPKIIIEKIPSTDVEEKYVAIDNEVLEKRHTEGMRELQEKLRSCNLGPKKSAACAEEILSQPITPSFNTPYPIFVRPVNSQYCLPSVASPMPQMTPVIMASPFQNFIASVNEIPQNSPVGFFPPSQNVFQCTQPQVFFGPQFTVMDMNNYAYEAYSPNVNTFYSSPAFY